MGDYITRKIKHMKHQTQEGTYKYAIVILINEMNWLLLNFFLNFFL